MFTRAFHIAGLIARISEWKASLLAIAAKRSAGAVIGYLLASMLMLAGIAVLVGAGYIQLAAIVGVTIAMILVGIFLFLLAAIIWAIAHLRGRSHGQPMTEHDVRMSLQRDQELLYERLGMTTTQPRPDAPTAETSTQAPKLSNGIGELEDPKVAIAAGFALLGLLGPGRLFRTVRIATVLASIAAVSNRAINEHRAKEGTKQQPPLPTASSRV